MYIAVLTSRAPAATNDTTIEVDVEEDCTSTVTSIKFN